MKRVACYYGYSTLNAIISANLVIDKDAWIYFKSGDYCCKFQGVVEFSLFRYGFRLEFNLGKWFQVR